MSTRKSGQKQTQFDSSHSLKCRMYKMCALRVKGSINKVQNCTQLLKLLFEVYFISCLGALSLMW
jgi:hypothetical protein